MLRTRDRDTHVTGSTTRKGTQGPETSQWRRLSFYKGNCVGNGTREVVRRDRASARREYRARVSAVQDCRGVNAIGAYRPIVWDCGPLSHTFPLLYSTTICVCCQALLSTRFFKLLKVRQIKLWKTA